MDKKAMHTEIEEFDHLLTIWIMASNDPIPLLTYRGITYRLQIPEESVKSLVRKHSELFRDKAPQHWINRWVAKLAADKHLPGWVRNLSADVEREEVLNALREDDFFRSQFRTAEDADPSSIELIRWGLEHIDRLRKVKAESNDERWKRAKEVWIPLGSVLGSILIASITITITSFFQYQNLKIQNDSLNLQKKLKQQELSFRPKLEGYAAFMDGVDVACDNAIKKSVTSKNTTANDFEVADQTEN